MSKRAILMRLLWLGFWLVILLRRFIHHGDLWFLSDLKCRSYRWSNFGQYILNSHCIRCCWCRLNLEWRDGGVRHIWRSWFVNHRRAKFAWGSDSVLWKDHRRLIRSEEWPSGDGRKWASFWRALSKWRLLAIYRHWRRRLYIIWYHS